MKVSEEIENLLIQSGIKYEKFVHEPVRTSEEASRVRPGFNLSQGAKAIIVKAKRKGGEKYFTMLVVPGDKRFDNEKVKSLLNAKEFRFAQGDEISRITGGVLPGGVPPFGNLFGLSVIADPALFRNEKIVFNAGDRSISIAMKSEDYRKLVNPRVVTIV